MDAGIQEVKVPLPAVAGIPDRGSSNPPGDLGNDSRRGISGGVNFRLPTQNSLIEAKVVVVVVVVVDDVGCLLFVAAAAAVVFLLLPFFWWWCPCCHPCSCPCCVVVVAVFMCCAWGIAWKYILRSMMMGVPTQLSKPIHQDVNPQQKAIPIYELDDRCKI